MSGDVPAVIREIIRTGYEDYSKHHFVPDHMARAVYAQLICRTEDNGFHAEYCPDGHYVRSHFNSCRHRMCPECGFIDKERWLQKRESMLLDCDHYHAIFTLPAVFNCFWFLNKGLMSDLLFFSATHVVREMLDDDRFLGAVPGIIAGLHTWSQLLKQHYHLHLLISGCGLAEDGELRETGEGFFLPFKKVMWDFRELFCDKLQEAFNEGSLKLPKRMSDSGFERLLRKERRKKWNVRFEDKYEHGRGVAIYLANYLRGGPISNKRVLSVKDGVVTISYADSKDKGETKRGKIKKAEFSIDEFLQRYLWHVPAPGSQMIRYYGLYSSSSGKKLDACRWQLGQKPVEAPSPLDWHDYLSE